MGLLVVAAGVVAAIRLLGPDGGTGRIVAPRPEAVSDVEPRPELPISALSVPVRVELGSLLDEVEEAVPREWGSLDERLQLPDDDRASLAIALRRGPFRGSIEGDTARLATTVSYRARGWYDLPVLPDLGASCGTGEGEPPPRLAVSLAGPISLTREWRLSTAARVVEVRPASDSERDRCEITIAGIDVTGRVVELARSFLEGHRVAIDSIVAEADVRSSFEAWWGVLRKPVRLDHDTWLDLRPLSARRGPIRGEGGVVEVPLRVRARPRVVLGRRPPAGDGALPPLDSGSVDTGVELLVDATAEYGAVGRRLTRSLAGTTLATGDRRVRIRSLEAHGIGGGRVALGVELEGDVSARLFLVGTPRYDPGTGIVAVPDLEFALETTNRLVAGASWLADVGIEALLRRRARWHVGPAVEWVAERIEGGLNQELTGGVRLEGSVRDVRILGVTARRERIVVRAAVTAEAELLIDEEA